MFRAYAEKISVWTEPFPAKTWDMPSTDTPVQRAGDERRSPWPLLAICSGYFMVILDTTVVNVAAAPF
jgi:hypothetical protein